MDLKQGIAIINQYTIKGRDGKGSRGSTPGQYVTRYMARDRATEMVHTYPLYDRYILDYMARESAIDKSLSISDAKENSDWDIYDGVAFNRKKPSLSKDELLQSSKEIQEAFDEGKTVLKTVISFDEEYLKERGIVEEGFECVKKGDYRGNIDQLKLRRGIIAGLEKMSGMYDDLDFVGVIQVDTMHVHCHLAMVDKGEGNLAKDGTQKGKISKRQKELLRRGIDGYLDEKQRVPFLSSKVQYERQNARAHVKRFVFEEARRRGVVQFLLATLPEDKRLWRASTNRKEMRRPNQLACEIVEETLQSGGFYERSMQRVQDYADYRKALEGLDDEAYDRLIFDGKNRLIDSCVNGLYEVLKEAEPYRHTETPFMDRMAADMDEVRYLSEGDEMALFAYKVRSYASRKEHHKVEYKRYEDAKKTFESLDASEDAMIVYDLLSFEAMYHRMALSKYMHFLNFLPLEEDFDEELARVRDLKDRGDRYDRALSDTSIQTLPPDEAEKDARVRYGINGGKYLVYARGVIESRRDSLKEEYEDRRRSFEVDLHMNGLHLNDDLSIGEGDFDFEDVKAVDIHQLSYDYMYDFPIAQMYVNQFVDLANTRYSLYLGVKDYLDRTGQENVGLYDEVDIRLMKEMADKLTSAPILKSKFSDEKHLLRRRTISLDYSEDLIGRGIDLGMEQPL